MRKTILTVLIVLGLALVVAGITIQTFPQWLGLPGGILLLLVAAFLGVADLGGKLKDWRELLFGESKASDKTVARNVPPTKRRTQNMNHSENGEQTMHGTAGTQSQEMKDSPGGKQKMD